MSLPRFKLVEDLETIKVIADERRLALLRLLVKPMTVKAIAAALEIPQSQLYYHVNLLEKHGLIQVVETNIVSGIVEKHYQATALQFGIRNPMLMGDAITVEETSAFFTAALNETTRELRQAFQAAEPRTADSPPAHPFVTRKPVRLTPEQLKHFHTKLSALIQECDQLTADANTAEETSEQTAHEYYLTVAFYQSLDES